MTVRETTHQIIVTSSDSQGKWQFRIQKAGNQIQLEMDMDENDSGEESFVDTNLGELIAIRDAINKVIGE